MTTTQLNQLTHRLETINGLSKGEIGQNRLVYSPTWVSAQQQVIKWGLDLGLQVSVDDFGTTYMDIPGTVHPDQVIAVGSHIDTVAQGGRFDGLYGVLGGLQAIEDLLETAGRPKKTIRLISFSEEEGSRFPDTFTGSKHYTNQKVNLAMTDPDGISFENARKDAVGKLNLPGVTHAKPGLPSTFTELHIEQGPRLIDRQLQIGLVTAIVGQRRFTVTVKGIANHAGTTPMDERADALEMAVTLISELRSRAHELNKNLTFTVGEMHVSPNTSNVIPGFVTFSIDTRYSSENVLDKFEHIINQVVEQNQTTNITSTVNRWAKSDVTHLDDQLLSANQKIADRLGFSSTQLASGAGHDSQIMAKVTRTTMIFVPSINGISHAPEENTSKEDLLRGVELLTESLRQQAY
ncbi:M20 family metallo-hydrolase [Lentilactobacillus kefiri]|uniref:Hydantoinase carbamoylase family amidase n=3 Tax=Lentilactobacillus kefiri TaxID=33962 RepID=A0A8E1RIL6_LENKE|nr:M20 family metallo-hydrolase [Lentilactobacillus kefiri]KRL73117.1 hydantoinase carbamoylase family amidase [Lentilactobacillus parakefiri DSM 10551]KRM52113.1 hydantoinase carbamoylase family amidase [Lentilactobacillus kefiri DSM 20587 = JCM 5818]MCJ2162645.1 M20 family metallo-hydrolase [Lentilactobacillus kefiri]MCP9369828.1 M20 family metallo-hydrolase [Lentilactobacillus kefiri]MDH5109296.1 M20 family metallo-hydrolase [Lentilactobacillus kefiri]